MPFYDFRCKQCGHAFTVRASFKEKDAGLQPACPLCRAAETQQVLTAGILVGQATAGNGRSLPLSLGGPACGCGPGGCNSE